VTFQGRNRKEKRGIDGVREEMRKCQDGEWSLGTQVKRCPGGEEPGRITGRSSRVTAKNSEGAGERLKNNREKLQMGGQG